jgi:tetratricopeptide (TPR) repeat protein/TolB-like protein
MIHAITARRLHATRRGSGQAAAVVMAFLASGSSMHVAANAQVQPPSRPAIVVVPFNTEGRDPRGYWLREASAVVLTDEFLALGIAAMPRDERLRAFDSLHVPATAPLSHATVIRVGQIVGAMYVVVGSFAIAGDTLTVRARSILLDSGHISTQVVESGPLANLFDIYQRVARRVADGVPRGATAVPVLHPPVAAFEQYIKGLLAEAPAMKLAFLREALRLSPSLEQARVAIWTVYNELGEHQNALAAVRQVPPTHALARDAGFLASVSLLQLNRHQESFDTLTELNRAALDGSLLNNLGVVQLRRPAVGATGRRAVSYFSDAVAVEGGDSDLLFNLGYAYWLERDLPNAIQSLREAVRRRPTDDAAHYVLGVALQMSGNTGEGARERELARRLSSEYAEWEKAQPPNTVPKGLERLRTELSAAAFRRVETEIVAAGQRSQQELAAFHIDAGRRAYLSERDDEAVASFRRAVYLSPYDAEAHLLLGRVYLRGGRHQEAVDELTISIWSRDTVAARLALAEAFLQTGNGEGARSELQVVISREPSNAEARRLLARLPPE